MVIHDSLCIIIFSCTRFHVDRNSIVVSHGVEACPPNICGHVDSKFTPQRYIFILFWDSADWYGHLYYVSSCCIVSPGSF